MDNRKLAEFDAILTNPEWVLVMRAPGEELSYAIYNIRTSHMMVIETESLHDEVCAEMLRRGARVLGQFPRGWLITPDDLNLND